MPLRFEINGIEIDIAQEAFTLDFIAENGGLNAIPINDDPVTIYKGDFDDPRDGLKLFNQLLNTNGLSPMPCRLIHSDPNIGVLKEGRYDTRKNEYSCSEADIYIISEFQDFVDRAEILNLKKLVETNEITKADYQKVGYVLDFEPKDLIGVVFSLVANLVNLIGLINAVRNEATRVTPPVPNVWVLVSMIIELTIAIAIQVKLVIEYIELIPKKLSYYAVPVRTLLEAGCKHLGYQFQSNLLSNAKFDNMVIIGSTEFKGVKKNKEPKNNPVPDFTLLDLIRLLGDTLRTKAVVRDGVVVLEEEKTFYEDPSNFVIPRMKDDENNPLTATHNVGEIPLSYTFGFATDSSDRNTTKENFSNKVTAHYVVEQFLESRQSDFFGVPESRILPVARAKRKNNLSSVENTYNDIIKGLTLPLRALGFGFADLIIQDEIKKCFKLETHGINVPKLLITDGNGFVSIANEATLNAENLYNEYHRQYTLAGGQNGYAFWTNYEGSLESGLCQEDQPNFLLSKLNRTLVARTKEGATAVLTMHAYNDETDSHDFRYKVNGWQNIFGFQFSDIKTPKVTEKLTVEKE